METKNLFITYNGVAYDFKATELYVTNKDNVKILRYIIELNPFDTIFIEQDRYNTWTQLVEKGSRMNENLLQKVGELIQKSFPQS